MDIKALITDYWHADPISAAVASLLLIFIVAALARKSEYTWYFIILEVVLIFSLLIDHPLAFCVFVLGGLAGLAEFIGKFKDEPIKAMRTIQAMTYLSFNGLIAVFAYALMIGYEVSIANMLDQIKVVVLAGFGSMLIMRSRLFNVKIGDEDYAFGPDQIIKVYLRFMEGAIDRVRAEDRYRKVGEVMSNVDFEQVYSHAIVALDATQILGTEEKKKLVAAIDAIRADAQFNAQQKSYRLGYVVLDAMGEDFLTAVFGELPQSMRLRAPLPHEPGVLARLPLFGEKTENYMAFGTNMSVARLRERLGWSKIDPERISSAVNRQKCTLPGFRLVFNVPDPDDASKQSAVANLVPDPQGVVEGVVYKLSKEAIEFLDRTETGYQRTEVSPLVDGRKVKAYAYVSPRTSENIKPTRDYLALVVRAARESNLSDTYVAELEKQATA